MKKTIIMMLTFMFGAMAWAQNADRLYEEGKALYDAKQYAQAVEKLLASAQKGHRKAQYRLGRCYDKGHGVEESDSLAFEWYLKAAGQGHAKAQYQVGKSYKNGEGVEKDKAKAVEYFTKAARQDNAEAQYALGKAYLNGNGVEADEAKAKSWLKKAIRNEKDGDEIREKLLRKAAEGDKTELRIKALLGL
ncbi:MAG: sel1 repeat family protein [Bacteroidaceae bacterium]|nr:sel1 repeat family protein [Bacteroidaceae bacterium]